VRGGDEVGASTLRAQPPRGVAEEVIKTGHEEACAMHASGGDRLARSRALGFGALAGVNPDDLGDDLAAMGAEEARHRLAPGVEEGRPCRAVPEMDSELRPGRSAAC
jgi:hypothetical protein